MIKFVFSVYDSKAGIYSTPFYSVHRNIAIRDFTRAVNTPENELHFAPDDFELYELGSFDDETGVFVTEKVFLMRGSVVFKLREE